MTLPKGDAMPTPYEVLCHECYATLTIKSRAMDIDGGVTLVVEPCPECISEAWRQAEPRDE
jgi:hypothetical protein